MHLSGHSVISTQNENRSIKFWSDVKADGTLQRMMQEAATAVPTACASDMISTAITAI